MSFSVQNGFHDDYQQWQNSFGVGDENASKKMIIGDDCCRTWWKWWDSKPAEDPVYEDPNCNNRFWEPINMARSYVGRDPDFGEIGKELAKRYPGELSKEMNKLYEGNDEKALTDYAEQMNENYTQLEGFNEKDYKKDLEYACMWIKGSDEPNCTAAEYLEWGEKFCLENPAKGKQCEEMNKNTLWDYVWTNNKKWHDLNFIARFDVYAQIVGSLCGDYDYIPCHKQYFPDVPEVLWQNIRYSPAFGKIEGYADGLKELKDAFDFICSIDDYNRCSLDGPAADYLWKLTLKYNEEYAKNNELACKNAAWILGNKIKDTLCPNKNNKGCIEDGSLVLSEDLIYCAKLSGIYNPEDYGKDLKHIEQMEKFKELTRHSPREEYIWEFFKWVIFNYTDDPDGYKRYVDFWNKDKEGGWRDDNDDVVNGYITLKNETMSMKFQKDSSWKYDTVMMEFFTRLYAACHKAWKGQAIEEDFSPQDIAACWPAYGWMTMNALEGKKGYFDELKLLRSKQSFGSGFACDYTSSRSDHCKSDKVTHLEQMYCTLAKLDGEECKTYIRNTFGCEPYNILAGCCGYIDPNAPINSVTEDCARKLYDRFDLPGECNVVQYLMTDKPFEYWDECVVTPETSGGGVFGNLPEWVLYVGGAVLGVVGLLVLGMILKRLF